MSNDFRGARTEQMLLYRRAAVLLNKTRSNDHRIFFILYCFVSVTDFGARLVLVPTIILSHSVVLFILKIYRIFATNLLIP